MSVENNEVRIIGIKPAHDSDDIPITQEDHTLLLAIGFCKVSPDEGVNWLTLKCDNEGKLLLG